jgi:protein-disulfide isomerase
MFQRSLTLFACRASLMLAAAAMFAVSTVRAEEFSPAQKAEIESIIKSYLVQNPEVLRDAAAELDAHDKLAEAKARQQIVGDPSSPLFDTTNQAVIGNPNGAVTLIEFFDYNCGYCKRALGDLARLMKDNPDLRVVLRDLPILTPGSIDAAKIANAAANQFKGAKFWEFHQRLLGSRGAVGKAEALAIAKDLGADMDKLSNDATQRPVAAAVDQSTELAKSLLITGTPSYVIGDDIVVGAVGYDDLQSKLVNVRKCGKVMCS